MKALAKINIVKEVTVIIGYVSKLSKYFPFLISLIFFLKLLYRDMIPFRYITSATIPPRKTPMPTAETNQVIY